MLNFVIPSLVLGAMAVVLGIYLVDLPSPPSSQVLPIVWNAEEVARKERSGSRADPGLKIRLNESGRGMIILPHALSSAVDYPSLHLEFPLAPAENSIQILWSENQSDDQYVVYAIPGAIEKSLWLDTRQIPQWTGNIGLLGVLVSGQPGSTFEISKIELLPSSLTHRLRAIYSNWTSHDSWQLSSINRHLGVGNIASSPYPVPLFAALMVLSLLAYWGLLYLFSASVHFDWRVVAMIILVGWLSLDLLWLGKLTRQIEDTYAVFADKTTEEQLAVGPDAVLFDFIAEVKQQLVRENSRVFVSSDNEYRGMRSAYYLYPRNVYWKRKKAGLPQQQYFRSGDYIVLLEPTNVQFDPETATLSSPQIMSLPVRKILTRRPGSAFEVK